VKGAQAPGLLALRLNIGYCVGMIRTHTFLPEPMLEKLRLLSKELDVPVAELIRRAIDEFLKKQK
jgi:hypothetical protein